MIVAAGAVLAACEKAEDRAAVAYTPPFAIGSCIEGPQAPPLHLAVGGCVSSANHAFDLRATRDGVVELHAVRAGREAEAVWTSGLKGKKPDDSDVVFQGDGNLVVYEAGAPLWDSGPLGMGDFRLAVTDDGNLVISTKEGRPLWLARFDVRYCAHELETPNQLGGGCLTSPSGAYAMVLTAKDGVEIAPVLGGKALGAPVWTSASPGHGPPASFLAVQPDGNVVVYDTGGPIWYTKTGGRSGVFRLTLTDQGELQLHDVAGKLLWSSRTGLVGPT
jgi:hypothetical protein